VKISIAMATYNGAQYIQEQLQSFVGQTRKPDELIITDDCSTDQTEAIVREFAKTAPFTVRFNRNEKNQGYCGNFNAALMKTTGDLVFLSDQDDVWFPKKIEHMIGVSERNPQALVLMNDAALTDRGLNEVGLTKVGQIKSAGYDLDSFVMGCCCVVRRELLSLCMPIPSGFKGHDNWLIWFADGLNAKVVDTNVLQYYRRHESNESRNIANRTEKVTRINAVLHSFGKLFCRPNVDPVCNQLEQLRMFEAAVSGLFAKENEAYKTQLVFLEARIKKRIIVMEARCSARDKAFFSRIMLVTNLLIMRRYNGDRFFRDFVRDIFIR